MASSAFFLLLVNLIGATAFRPTSIYRSNVETFPGRNAAVLSTASLPSQLSFENGPFVLETPASHATYHAMIIRDIENIFKASEERTAKRIDKVIKASGERTAERIDKAIKASGERTAERIDKAIKASGERIDKAIKASGERRDKAIKASGERRDKAIKASGERCDKAIKASGERIEKNVQATMFSRYTEPRRNLTMEMFTRVLAPLIKTMGFRPAASSIYRNNNVQRPGRKGPNTSSTMLHKKNPCLWKSPASVESSKQRLVASTTALKCSLEELDGKAAEWKFFMERQVDCILCRFPCINRRIHFESVDNDGFDNTKKELDRGYDDVMKSIADLKTSITKVLREEVTRIRKSRGTYNPFFDALEDVRDRIYDALESALWFILFKVPLLRRIPFVRKIVLYFLTILGINR
jgi:DNA-binding transcriptional ArsR family regulator